MLDDYNLIFSTSNGLHSRVENTDAKPDAIIILYESLFYIIIFFLKL